MKGLLIKDLKLLSQYKRSYAILLVVIVVMFIQQDEGSYAFIIAYTTMLVGIFASSTISMDENGKSMPFFMTLPITREVYVAEKYVLSIGGSLLGCILAMLICVFVHTGQAGGVVWQGLAAFMVLSFYHMIMLPLQLKFNDKSRIALLGLVAFAITALTVARKTAEHINTSPMWISIAGLRNAVVHFIDGIFSQNKWLVGIASFIIWLICLTISFMVSKAIMCNKEF